MTSESAKIIYLRDVDGSARRLLPRSVRMVSKDADAPPSPAAMFEFEVVAGNAAYREGERFFLTQAQAQRVYRMPAA